MDVWNIHGTAHPSISMDIFLENILMEPLRDVRISCSPSEKSRKSFVASMKATLADILHSYGYRKRTIAVVGRLWDVRISRKITPETFRHLFVCLFIYYNLFIMFMLFVMFIYLCLFIFPIVYLFYIYQIKRSWLKVSAIWLSYNLVVRTIWLPLAFFFSKLGQNI